MAGLVFLGITDEPKRLRGREAEITLHPAPLLNEEKRLGLSPKGIGVVALSEGRLVGSLHMPESSFGFVASIAQIGRWKSLMVAGNREPRHRELEAIDFRLSEVGEDED